MYVYVQCTMYKYRYIFTYCFYLYEIYIFNHLGRFHPHFKNVMQSRISQMMGINYKFDLLLSEDGSGRGAALVAAVLKRGKAS